MKILITFMLMHSLSLFAQELDLNQDQNLSCSYEDATAYIELKSNNGERFINIAFYQGSLRYLQDNMPLSREFSDDRWIEADSEADPNSLNRYNITIYNNRAGETLASVYIDWTLRGASQGLLLRTTHQLVCK